MRSLQKKNILLLLLVLLLTLSTAATAQEPAGNVWTSTGLSEKLVGGSDFYYGHGIKPAGVFYEPFEATVETDLSGLTGTPIWVTGDNIGNESINFVVYEKNAYEGGPRTRNFTASSTDGVYARVLVGEPIIVTNENTQAEETVGYENFTWKEEIKLFGWEAKNGRTASPASSTGKNQFASDSNFEQAWAISPGKSNQDRMYFLGMEFYSKAVSTNRELAEERNWGHIENNPAAPSGLGITRTSASRALAIASGSGATSSSSGSSYDFQNVERYEGFCEGKGYKENVAGLTGFERSGILFDCAFITLVERNTEILARRMIVDTADPLADSLNGNRYTNREVRAATSDGRIADLTLVNVNTKFCLPPKTDLQSRTIGADYTFSYAYVYVPDTHALKIYRITVDTHNGRGANILQDELQISINKPRALIATDQNYCNGLVSPVLQAATPQWRSIVAVIDDKPIHYQIYDETNYNSDTTSGCRTQTTYAAYLLCKERTLGRAVLFASVHQANGELGASEVYDNRLLGQTVSGPNPAGLLISNVFRTQAFTDTRGNDYCVMALNPLTSTEAKYLNPTTGNLAVEDSVVGMICFSLSGTGGTEESTLNLPSRQYLTTDGIFNPFTVDSQTTVDYFRTFSLIPATDSNINENIRRLNVIVNPLGIFQPAGEKYEGLRVSRASQSTAHGGVAELVETPVDQDEFIVLQTWDRDRNDGVEYNPISVSAVDIDRDDYADFIGFTEDGIVAWVYREATKDASVTDGFVLGGVDVLNPSPLADLFPSTPGSGSGSGGSAGGGGGGSAGGGSESTPITFNDGLPGSDKCALATFLGYGYAGGVLSPMFTLAVVLAVIGGLSLAGFMVHPIAGAGTALMCIVFFTFTGCLPSQFLITLGIITATAIAFIILQMRRGGG